MHKKMSDGISIIIPFYNEEKSIEKIIQCLKPLKTKCEIIFVDGGSTDKTQSILKKDFLVLNSPKKGRAAQMNFGVSHSNNAILFFLHADSVIPKGALTDITKIINSGYEFGCFKIKFDSKNKLMKIMGALSNFRVKSRKIIFGDQGIFIRKELFIKSGGFKEIPIMEDYDFSLRMRKRKIGIGQTKSYILTSERRFVDNGRFKTIVQMQKLQYLFRKGIDINIIANMYK